MIQNASSKSQTRHLITYQTKWFHRSLIKLIIINNNSIRNTWEQIASTPIWTYFFCSRLHHCNSKIVLWIQPLHYLGHLFSLMSRRKPNSSKSKVKVSSKIKHATRMYILRRSTSLPIATCAMKKLISFRRITISLVECRCSIKICSFSFFRIWSAIAQQITSDLRQYWTSFGVFIRLELDVQLYLRFPPVCGLHAKSMRRYQTFYSTRRNCRRMIPT